MNMRMSSDKKKKKLMAVWFLIKIGSWTSEGFHEQIFLKSKLYFMTLSNIISHKNLKFEKGTGRYSKTFIIIVVMGEFYT